MIRSGSLIVKVFYNKSKPTSSTEQTSGASGVGIYQFIRYTQTPTNFKTYLTVKNHIITETEKNFISGNIINVTPGMIKILLYLNEKLYCVLQQVIYNLI